MFHGAQFYVSVSGGGFDLQDFLLQSAIQPTGTLFARKWANLYSRKILAQVGGFTSPRATVFEQRRTPLLVARVPVSALATLVVFALAYTVLGVCLGFAAYRASAVDVRDIAAQLTLPGLAFAAFGEKRSRSLTMDEHGQAVQTGAAIFKEKTMDKESRRVVIDGNPEDGFEFRVSSWV